MNAQQHFIEPLDVLIVRGNRLFGDPGSYGESIVPPWPSVAAGALRSALLAYKGIDPHQFAEGALCDQELGTPERPGSFVLTEFSLARRMVTLGGQVEPLRPPPADLVVRKQDDGTLVIETVRPRSLPDGIHCSRATPCLAVLSEQKRGKPESGIWLTLAGWNKHLAGKPVDPNTDLVRSTDLWRVDVRVGVGLDPHARRAADGALFSTQAVALLKAEHQADSGGHNGVGFDVGFLAETTGAHIPDDLPLRFGGDSRAALCRRALTQPTAPDYDTLAKAGRCRIVLTTPGIFGGGWLPTGATRANTEIHFDLRGVRGRLICAAVPRAEIVSGFDMAKGRPKSAQRVAPVGSVYWLEELQATPEALRNLATQGLWSDSVEDPIRRAEGFNRLAFATY